MRLDYQNLNEGDEPRYWRYGRAWLRRDNGYRGLSLRAEWTIPAGGCRWGVTFGDGDSGRDLGCTFSIPFLITLYLTLENIFPAYIFGTDFDRGSDRQITVYFFEGAIWYSFWVGTMASWSRSYPWCRWWRQGSFHFASLLGKQAYSRETIKAGIPVTIPMPEGVYHGVAKIERQTWKRPLWCATSRMSTTIDCPKGIPFQGKGENSWDCGDDGLFGWGTKGSSIEHAIAHGVESVLVSRRRYGKPSDAAIREALA